MFCGGSSPLCEFSCSVESFCTGQGSYNSPSLVYGSTNIIALWSLIRRSNAPQGCELPENKDNAQDRVWLRNQAQEK